MPFPSDQKKGGGSISADTLENDRLWWRRPAYWPTPRSAWIALGLGLALSVALVLVADIAFEATADHGLLEGTVDRLAVAAMLPFVLLCLPRRILPVDGVAVDRPMLRAVGLIAIAGPLWAFVVVLSGREIDFAPMGAWPAIFTMWATVLQVVTEELLFRLLLPLLLVRMFGRSPRGAVVATVTAALLFGVFHAPASPVQFLDHVLFALLMQWVLSAARTVRVPIILHMANNVYAHNFAVGPAAAESVPLLLAAKFLILFAVASILFPARTPWPAAAWTQRFAAPRTVSTAEVASSPRSVVVDALRGLAFFLIVLENLLVFLPAESGTGTDRPSGADRVTRAAMALLIEYRGLPLFALLLGFGVYVLMQRATGPERASAVSRRNLAFIVLGAFHGLLIFSGDILAVYGLLLYALLWAVRTPQRVRVMTWISGALFSLQTLVLPFTLLVTTSAEGEAGTSALASTATEAFTVRPTEWLLLVITTPLLSSGLLFPMLIGYRSASRVLGREPAPPASRTIAVVLGMLSLALCWPYASVLWSDWGDAAAVAAYPWYLVAAQFGGLCGALAGWIAIMGIRSELSGTGAGARLLVTLGRRSLTLYLAHSTVFLLLLTPPFGGLSTVVSLSVLVPVSLLVIAGAGVVLGRTRTSGAGLAEGLIRDMAAGPAPVKGPEEADGRVPAGDQGVKAALTRR